MSSGCIPNKQDRLKALEFAKAKVKNAYDILSSLDHPDDDPRAMEEAAGLLLDASGDYTDGTQTPALDDLCEHYFS
jgi:hypothetical protein